MNCQQLTSLTIEAARGRMMDAAARDGAMHHAETCEACAARLGQEQNLTSALRTVAAGMKDLSAPAHIEATLLAAFRETHAASAAATTNVSPGQVAAPAAPAALPASAEMTARLSSHPRSWIAVAVKTALAASLALVALVTLYWQFTRTATPQEMPGVVAQVGKEPSTNAPAFATPSPSPLPAGLTGQATRNRPRLAERAATRRTSPRPTPAAQPAIIASRQVIDGGRAIFLESEGESAANGAAGLVAKPDEAESVTEFIPLVAGAPAATPLEGGQLVRVQLPRAALASLGLPLNVERGNEERVRADVLLGNDGMARAIRFVR